MRLGPRRLSPASGRSRRCPTAGTIAATPAIARTTIPAHRSSEPPSPMCRSTVAVNAIVTQERRRQAEHDAERPRTPGRRGRREQRGQDRQRAGAQRGARTDGDCDEDEHEHAAGRQCCCRGRRSHHYESRTRHHPAAMDEIEHYLSNITPGQRAEFERIRGLVLEAAPGVEEVFSYRMPGFAVGGTAADLGRRLQAPHEHLPGHHPVHGRRPAPGRARPRDPPRATRGDRADLSHGPLRSTAAAR